LVERLLAMQKVEGSSPFIRLKKDLQNSYLLRSGASLDS